MKIPTMLLTAGLAIASLGVSVSANAQNYNGGDRHDQNYGDHRSDHRDDRNRGDWHDRGRHYGWNRHNGWNRHQHCWTEWHHHHRERICR